jgi:hypothetical protein
MYPFRQAYFIELAATGGNAVIDVPIQTEEPLQYLSATVYMADHSALGTGSMGLLLGGDTVATATAFAGHKLILPVFPQAGEPHLLFPANANPYKENYHLIAGSTSTTYTTQVDQPKLLLTPMTLVARVTNGAAVPVQMVLEWNGVALRV